MLQSSKCAREISTVDKNGVSGIAVVVILSCPFVTSEPTAILVVGSNAKSKDDSLMPRTKLRSSRDKSKSMR